MQNTRVVFATNPEIYVDNKNLNQSFIIYISDINISNYKLFSKCTKNTNFVRSYKNLYIFKITNFPKNCIDTNVYLQWKFGKIYKNTKFHFKIIKKEELISKYIDYSDEQLKKLKKEFKNKLSKIPKIEPFAFKKASYIDKIYMTKTLFEKQIYIYKISLINKILILRKNKYIIPITWKKLPIRRDKIPNAGRGYRSHYTDWIHHGWDIDSPLGTPVIALDNWIIVRIVDWSWSDFSKIKYWKNLTKLDKERNLNILRWKQVWLKTMKWDVVFYSHLENIPENLKIWDYIWVWTKLWEVNISWVPDKSYNDYHLHFSIQKNPHIISKAWKYTYDDYMLWDWTVKWMKKDEIISWQKKFFNTNETNIKISKK